MPRHVPPAGKMPCGIFVCGERPGYDEAIAGEPFVGPAGQELFDKLWRTNRLTRGDVFITNLVDTFSPDPPTDAEILANVRRLRLELLGCQPTLILTVGYHAARAFLAGSSVQLPYTRYICYGCQKHAPRFLGEGQEDSPLLDLGRKHQSPSRVRPANVPRSSLEGSSPRLSPEARARTERVRSYLRESRMRQADALGSSLIVGEQEASIRPDEILSPRPSVDQKDALHRAWEQMASVLDVHEDTQQRGVRCSLCLAPFSKLVEAPGDFFHGLAFPYTYGLHRPRTATLVPLVHSAAALRQPGLYQNQFWADLLAVRRVREGRQPLHRPAPVQPYRVGLASLCAPGQDLGLDTEGLPGAPEAVTLSSAGLEAALVEVFRKPPGPALRAAVLGARRLYIHNAVHDWQVLHALGIPIEKAECTMLMAYLLGLPQSLKVLAYRELGMVMREYDDLVGPLDETLVRTTLEAAHARFTTALDERARAATAAAHRHRSLIGRPDTKSCAARYLRRAPLPLLDGRPLAPRALTSLQSLLTKPADATLRARWHGSTFAPLVPLPPEPTWKDVPEAERTPYALTDAIAHRRIGELLRPRLKALGLSRVYQLDRSVLPFLVRMEQVGMAVDADALHALDATFGRDFGKVCDRINVLAGKPVNPLSGEQVSDCLFTELGIRPTRMTKSQKHYTTQDKYLKARRLEHKIVPLILEARQLNKYRGTYTSKLPGMLVSGRYHPDWKYTRTATGRLAEEIILLIPKHSARAKDIRNAFHAGDGRTLVSVDLSQIELRSMAHLSGDRRLLDAFARGRDIHAEVAHALLGAPRGKENQDESLHRLPAKTLNFGIINGMTEFGMLDQLHEAGQRQWTIDTVREMLVEWFRLHKGVDDYWEQQKAFARSRGYVTDLFGRRRYLYAVHSTSEQVRREAERQCLCPIQATADGISKIWNRRIYQHVLQPRWAEKRRYCEPWVRMHDDTTVEVDARIARTVQQEMLRLVPQLLKVPTLAEGKRGEQWGVLSA